MSFSIRCLQQLLYEIQKWPGFGPRSAQKLVIHLLKNKDSSIPSLIKSLKTTVENIKSCSQCFGWTENSGICSICQDPSRDRSSLCVLENPFDIFRIENSNVFQGYYHVLHGLISPLQNVAPEDLTITALLKNVKTHSIREVILALDTNLEGDTTAMYLVKMLQPFNVKISRLAMGIPLGSHLDFIDDRTLSQALENRIEM